jgi:hypothetical protein
MSKPTITDEKAGRAALKTFLETMPILGKVFTRRRRIDSRSRFVELFGVVPPAAGGKQKIVRFCEIEFLRPVDSPTEGFDDCPLLEVVYGLHLFHEFFDGTDDSNSQDDFIDAILQLRTAFLDTRNWTAGLYNLNGDPIVANEFARFGNDTFTDCTGHFIDLLLTVRFYDFE